MRISSRTWSTMPLSAPLPLTSTTTVPSGAPSRASTRRSPAGRSTYRRGASATVKSYLIAISSGSDPAAHPATAGREVGQGDAGDVDVDLHGAARGGGPEGADDPAVERLPASGGQVLGTVLDALGDPQADACDRLALVALRLVVGGKLG